MTRIPERAEYINDSLHSREDNVSSGSQAETRRAPNHRLHRINEGVSGDLRVFLIQVVRK